MADRNLSALEECLAQWTATSCGRRAFLKSLPLLLAACASGEKTRYREGDNSGQQALSVRDEEAMTAKVLPEMRKEYPPVRNQELQSYVSELGQKLVRANQLDGRPYQYNFSVVDVSYVNAFALPAGTVFITAPLIAMADTEAELVGVIGHEVGHIKARHTAERIVKAQKEQNQSWIYGLGGGLVGAAAGFGLGRLLCQPKDRECLAKASLYGAAAGAGGGLLIQKFGFMANSREDEMEADRIGFRTAVRTGYAPKAVGQFYNKLWEMEKQAKSGANPLMASLTDAMSTHPPSAERVQQMNQMASEVKAPANARISSTQFDRMRLTAHSISQKKQKSAS